MNYDDNPRRLTTYPAWSIDRPLTVEPDADVTDVLDRDDQRWTRSLTARGLWTDDDWAEAWTWPELVREQGPLRAASPRR